MGKERREGGGGGEGIVVEIYLLEGFEDIT
jgi:hypothetical protein